MDYNKIGKFIAEERKARKMTQSKLAEKLFVSEKTISKWENGKGIPDSSLLPKICEIFQISINDLLSGERISSDVYVDKAEVKLLELQRKKEESDKRLLFIEVGLGVITTISFLIILFFSCYTIQNSNLKTLSIVMLVIGVIIFLVGVSLCLLIEQKAGYYICKKCSHKHVPTYKQVLVAPHINRTRYMKCPNCQKRSWQKKVVK